MERDGNGGFDVECDECGEERHVVASNFHDAADELRELGWRIARADDEWVHACPECVNSLSEDIGI